MTKQEIIKEAYGEHWEAVKNFVDENGIINWGIHVYNNQNKNLSSLDSILEYISETCMTYRTPKSLRGIENNRGWTTIESEADLPKTGHYFVVDKINGIRDYYFIKEDSGDCNFWINQLTHYQPIQKPQPPIY